MGNPNPIERLVFDWVRLPNVRLDTPGKGQVAKPVLCKMASRRTHFVPLKRGMFFQGFASIINCLVPLRGKRKMVKFLSGYRSRCKLPYIGGISTEKYGTRAYKVVLSDGWSGLECTYIVRNSVANGTDSGGQHMT